MRNWNYKWFLGIGFVLVVLGVVLPLLMVVKILPSTLFLNFFSYIASFLGLMFGIIGSAFYTAKHRKRKTRNWEDEDENHHS